MLAILSYKSISENMLNIFFYNVLKQNCVLLLLFLGIYLCVVMAMTSVSVILGVMVINIYNRGMKMRRAPFWVRRLILEKIAPAVRMRCNMEVLARSIKLVRYKV